MESVDYRILACIIYSIGYIVAVLMSFSYCNKLKDAGYKTIESEFQMISIMSLFSWVWVILLAVNWNELKTKK